MEEKKVGRAVNLYNKDTGFVYIVNLYIINYIYYHMKKHDAFIENKKGKKPKSYDLFGDIIHISRPRFSRITQIGFGRFELTSLEADNICNVLGIDTIYFQKDSPEIIALPKIEEEDWKCFLYLERGIPYNDEMETKKEHEIEEQTDKVKKALSKAARTNWDAIGPEKEENPIYQIWYYFKYNVRYEKKSDIEMMISYLKRIKYSDWRRAGEARIKESYDLLNLHCEFLKAVILVNQRLSEEK